MPEFYFELIDGVEVPWEVEKYPPIRRKWGRVEFYNTKTGKYELFPGLGLTEEEIRKEKSKASMERVKKQKARFREEGRCVRCGAARDLKERLQCAKCREKSPKVAQQQYRKQREAVFSHYGWSCICCGETEPLFLAIDHGPGAPSRKDNPKQKINLTKWVVDNGFPAGFRILCHNCNMSTRYGRTCPHQRDILNLKAALPQV